jgi:hypothetical protein
MRLHRGWTIVSTGLLAVILLATLTPVPGTPVTANFWCIACGELGALDVTANIVMFVPLGLALGLATGRRWPSVLACVAVTLAIELLQVRVVVGRDASVSDLLANSLGGWIGVELALRHRPVIRPSAPAAAWLAGAAAAMFAAVCALTSFGLEPAAIPRSLWIQWAPPRPSYEPFTGRVLAFDVDGIDLPLGFPPASSGLDRLLAGPQWQATTTISTEHLEPRRSVIARIAEEYTVLVSVEQAGLDVVCRQKTRSSDFRFRSPKVTVRDGLAAGDETVSVMKLACARRHAWLVAGADGREARLRLSPALGWYLMSPFDLTITTTEAWVGLLWLLGLSFPAGYWAGFVRGHDAGGRRRVWLVTTTIGVASLAGLSLVPGLTETSTANALEWTAAVTGVLLGVVVGRAVARRSGASAQAMEDDAARRDHLLA